MRRAAWLVALALLVPASAEAQEAVSAESPKEAARVAVEGGTHEDSGPRFGRAHTAIISSAFGLGFSSASYDDPAVYSRSVSFDPGFDYFVSDDWSLGLGLDLTWSTSQGYDVRGQTNRTTRAFEGFEGRLGYNAHISRIVSWWFRLALGYSHADTTLESSVPAPDGYPGHSSDLGGIRFEHTDSGYYFDAFAPLLVHPIPHWFVGLGPALYRDLSRGYENTANSSNDRTTLSLRLVTGVWF